MDSIEAECRELAARVLDCARDKGLTLGCAESCTGGLIASYLTAVPGSSDVFVGGIVSYWVDVKESVLGVDHALLAEDGVVSESCARSMAQGARRVLACDIAISTTGIAGPTGAEPGKPVGTVCFCVASADQSRSFTACEGSTRDEVRLLACKRALVALIEEISR